MIISDIVFQIELVLIKGCKKLEKGKWFFRVSSTGA